MKSSFDFAVQYYFPSRIIWTSAAVLFLAGGVVTKHFILAVIALIVGVLVFTTRYGVEINLAEQLYTEYVWVLGYRSGEKIKFENIEYLYINKLKVTQGMSSLLNSTTIDSEEYRGYIKFNEQEKIHFITKGNHQKLIIELKRIAQSMGVGLFDYSSGGREQLA